MENMIETLAKSKKESSNELTSVSESVGNTVDHPPTETAFVDQRIEEDFRQKIFSQYNFFGAALKFGLKKNTVSPRTQEN